MPLVSASSFWPPLPAAALSNAVRLFGLQYRSPWKSALDRSEAPPPLEARLCRRARGAPGDVAVPRLPSPAALCAWNLHLRALFGRFSRIYLFFFPSVPLTFPFPFLFWRLPSFFSFFSFCLSRRVRGVLHGTVLKFTWQIVFLLIRHVDFFLFGRGFGRGEITLCKGTLLTMLECALDVAIHRTTSVLLLLIIITILFRS